MTGSISRFMTHTLACAILSGDGCEYMSQVPFDDMNTLQTLVQSEMTKLGLYLGLDHAEDIGFDLDCCMHQLWHRHWCSYEWVSKYYCVCVAIDSMPGYIEAKDLQRGVWDWKTIQTEIDFFSLLQRVPLSK